MSGALRGAGARASAVPDRASRARTARVLDHAARTARDAAAAAIGFLRGFVGVQADVHRCDTGCATTPGQARDALAARASRRPNCC